MKQILKFIIYAIGVWLTLAYLVNFWTGSQNATNTKPNVFLAMIGGLIVFHGLLKITGNRDSED